MLPPMVLSLYIYFQYFFKFLMHRWWCPMINFLCLYSTSNPSEYFIKYTIIVSSKFFIPLIFIFSIYLLRFLTFLFILSVFPLFHWALLKWLLSGLCLLLPTSVSWLYISNCPFLLRLVCIQFFSSLYVG